MWMVLIAFGIAVVTLAPENFLGGKVLFRLSRQHGPTISDTIGLLLILSGWLYYLWTLWSNRSGFERRKQIKINAGMAIVSIIGCIAAAFLNLNILIILLALLAFIAQIRLGLLIKQT